MPTIPPAAEERIYSLAYALDGPDRAAFIAAATEAIETLGPGCAGPGSIHRTVAKVWRAHFRPPTQTAPIEPARRRDGDGGESKRDRRRERTAAPPKPVMWRGVKYPSRTALALALAPHCGDREPNAIACMLVKLGDDGDAVIAHYAGKRKPKSATFASPA